MVVVDSQSRIVVGIDFGTTFSGCAWARSGKPDNISIITNWKSKLRGNFDVQKAPTQIHFGAGNGSSSRRTPPRTPRNRLDPFDIWGVHAEPGGAEAPPPPSGETTWGFNIPMDEMPLKWFKLLLIEERDIPTNLRESRQLREARELLRKEGKSVGEVVAAYLRALCVLPPPCGLPPTGGVSQPTMAD
jgi:hypothetical protein